jgi:hypothetical protein
MDLTHDFLIGRWRLQSWVSKRIVHSPEEDRAILHAIDGIPYEEVEIKVYNVWEAQRSNVYEHAFLRSFKNDSEMVNYEMEFTNGKPAGSWSGLAVRNFETGEVIKDGSWETESYTPNSINLSVWNYNIHLKVKILSLRQILLKELFEDDETESDTHEFILQRI